MLAMKKLKPSRPRRLRRDGARKGADSAGGTGGWCTSDPRFSQACTFRHPRSVIQWVLACCQWLGVARRTQNHHRFAFLVFGRRFKLIARQAERDVLGCACRGELQRGPIDGDLAATHAQKTAEIDYCGPRYSGFVDNDIDNATHVLALGICDGLAKDGLGLVLG